MNKVLDSIRQLAADYSAEFGTSPRDMLIDLLLGTALVLVLVVEATIGIAGVWS